MNRRRFLTFLGALGPGLALARAGLGAGAAPVTITTPWIKLPAARYGPGRYVVTFPEPLTVLLDRVAINRGDWEFSIGDTRDDALPAKQTA